MARTRAKDFDDKQRGFLLTAAHVFATQGMEKASMSGIAAQAGVSKSLLYHYYPSKSALIFSIICTHLEELDAALAQSDDPTQPLRTRLQSMIAAALRVYEGADDQHKVLLNAGEALSPEQRSQITQHERQIVRRLSELLEQINPALRQGDTPMLMPVTMSLFGMLNWLHQWFRADGPLSREAYAEMVTALLLDGLRALR